MRKFWQKRYISKYTGKEIDDAVAKAGNALQNPMTAAGDLIVGGEDGAAEKLVKGTDGKVLKMVSGSPAWADDAGGMENPMTTAGDMIAGSIEGAPYRIPKGTQGQVLTMGASFPEWAAASGGDHIYWHSIRIGKNSAPTIYSTFVTVLNTSSTPFTKTTFGQLLNEDLNARYLAVNGYATVGAGVLLPQYFTGYNPEYGIIKLVMINGTNGTESDGTFEADSINTFEDTVTQIV